MIPFPPRKPPKPRLLVPPRRKAPLLRSAAYGDPLTEFPSGPVTLEASFPFSPTTYIFVITVSDQIRYFCFHICFIHHEKVLLKILITHHIEFNQFAIAYATDCFLWVILNNCSLVHEHIFFCVISIDKPIT